jgi:LPS export ABC transporter protein LptC
MTRWHRPVRLLLGLFVVVFAIGVYVSIGKRRAPAASPGSVRTDPNAVVESTRGQSILHKGSKQDIRIDYERQLTYQSGRSKFFGAKVLVLDRAGRNFEISAREAEVAENQSQIDMRGDVSMTTSDGLTVKTNDATYTESDGVVRAPGPVSFARERMKGTSVGASYDRHRDVLWLLDQAHVTVAPDAKGGGGADVRAGAAGYARTERYIRFERGVKMLRGAQVVEADGAVAYLRPDRDALQMLDLRGHARVAGVGQAASGLQAMSARDMNLRYADDGQTLTQATLTGEAAVQLAGAEGAPGARLAAQAIDIEMAPDGQTAQTLASQDGVQLDLPAGPNAPARQIRSAALEGRGAPGAVGIREARFTDNVEFRETQSVAPGAPAAGRLVHAKVLEAQFQSGFSSIDRATFSGGVTVKDQDRDANGPSMIYDVAKGTLALFGPEGDLKTITQANDARANIQARRLDWTVDGTRMVGEGDVKSVLKAQSRPGQETSSNGRAGEAVKRPSMLASDQPVNVTSQRLVYARDTGRAEYTGDAQLWQGQTTIKADAITLDESTGNLIASGSVRSVMRLEPTDPKRPQGSQGPQGPRELPADTTAPAGQPAATGPRRGTETIATAADLLYDDAERRATYTTQARVVGEQGDLRAEKIEIYLDESGRGLERLEGYTNVALKSPASADRPPRWGSSDRLTYFAEDERYVMSGSRVHVIEQLARECRETTGRTLTFFRATDSIAVDGNQESRTQTRSGGKCPEQRP